MSEHIYPGADYPHLNTRANQTVRLELSTSSTPSGGAGRVSLRISDHASGETLVDVQIDPAEMWRLIQGGSQTWPAWVSPNLDRVGRRMENQRVNLPPALPDDTDKDIRRDVWKAVQDQLPEDWHGTWESYDTPRVDNTRTRYTIVRRWR